jgi:hypothetical protein
MFNFLRMTRLTANQIIDLNILINESSGDDSCDESEIDIVEVEDNLIALSSDEEGIDERENQDLDFEFEEDEISVPNVMNPQLSKSNTVDMISAENHDSNKIIYGRVNKSTHKTPFRWFENQHEIYDKNPIQNTRIIPLLKSENSIETFFKMLIPISMVEKIAKYTNKKIKIINRDKELENESYRLQRHRLESVEVNADEIYAFIGLLILLGITKKSDTNIESLWKESSLDYAPFAAATFSRDRFKLISKNLTFDNLDSRATRSSQKFYKMAEIFNDFKENLPLIIPSSLLCVDEELYAFRGNNLPNFSDKVFNL